MSEPISEQERQRRARSVRLAIAFNQQSGLESSALTKELSEQFINGEITKEEYVARLLKASARKDDAE
jgi:hypothetical protein